MKDKQILGIDAQTVESASTEMKCPGVGCDSIYFFPTMQVKRVSPLMTGTGKPGALTKSGPLLCVKCHRELTDADFGYTGTTPDTLITGDKEETEENRYLED